MTRERNKFSDSDEIRYIPVGLPDLIKGLLGVRPIQEATERNAFARFSELLQALYHTRYFEYYRDLKHYYQPFNPDKNVLSTARLSESERQDYQKQFFDGLKLLLTIANYDEFSPDNNKDPSLAEEPQATEEPHQASPIDAASEILVFVRGCDIIKQNKRDWRTLFLTSVTRSVDVYSRLFVAIKSESEGKLREILEDKGQGRFSVWSQVLQHRALTPSQDTSGFILLSSFRDIPLSDLQNLFPRKGECLSIFDKEELDELDDEEGLLAKLATIKPKLLLRSLTGLSGMIIQYTRSLLRLKTNYQRILSQGLASHQLDINVGVIDSLVDQAREEEIKEALLAYYFLMRANKEGLTQAVLNQQIESHLIVRYGVFVDFKAREPVKRLKQDGLIIETEGGVLKAVPIEEAGSAITSQWENLFSIAKRLSLLGKV